MSSGIVPDALKISRVFPLCDSGKKNQNNNYRSLSIYIKNNEKDTCIINCISLFGIISTLASSRTPDLRGLLDMQIKIAEAMDNSRFSIVLFKAFNTVDHHNLN